MLKKKKVLFKWVIGETSGDILLESFNSVKNQFQNIEAFSLHFKIFYNGPNFKQFMNRYALHLKGAEIADQKSFISANYPVPLRKSLWKQFPNIRQDLESYEIYIDSDILLIKAHEILQWINSPIPTLLLYKNDSGKTAYKKGPTDLTPLISKLKGEQGNLFLDADLCAGFYGLPPGLGPENIYLNTLKEISEKFPQWKNPKAKGYGSDQGLFFLFILNFLKEDKTYPVFLLSNERHPFFSLKKHWFPRFIDLNRVEFLHLTGAGFDWREDHSFNTRLYKHLKRKISGPPLPILSQPIPLIKTINPIKLSKREIKGQISWYKKNSIINKLLSPILLKLLSPVFGLPIPLKFFLNRFLGRFEKGEYEMGLLLDVLTTKNILLFSFSVDIREGAFRFDPRIFFHEPVRLVFRENNRILLEKIVMD